MAVGKGIGKCQDLISTTRIPTYICIWDFAHRLGWNVVGLNLDHFYNYIPTGLLSVSSSLKPLFRCFEHFCARNISKIRLRFVIWAFSSLRNQICSLKAGFTTRKMSLSTFDKHHPNTSWYFESPSSWLFSAHLDVLASAVHILKLERYRED